MPISQSRNNFSRLILNVSRLLLTLSGTGLAIVFVDLLYDWMSPPPGESQAWGKTFALAVSFPLTLNLGILFGLLPQHRGGPIRFAHKSTAVPVIGRTLTVIAVLLLIALVS